MIALIVAMSVLLFVGGNSYNNYLRTQYEKEYGVLDKHQEKAVDAIPVSEVGQQDGTRVVTSTLDPGHSRSSPLSQSIPSATTPNYRTDTPMPPSRETPPSSSLAGVRQPDGVRAGANTDAGAVAAIDPEIERLKAKLEAARQENMLYQQKLQQVRVGGREGGSVVSQAESGSLREVMNRADKSGASAALFPKEGTSGSGQSAAKSEYEKLIMNASAIGKVVVFNAEWGFVQIDVGRNRNITEGTKLAVRRGVSIVGYVKVAEVNDATAIAELTSRNEFSETARKPKPGDDLISWPLF